MQVNPILKKEFKIRGRSFKFPIMIMIYNSILAFIAIIMVISLNAAYSYGENVDIQDLSSFYYVAAWIQFAVMCVMVPALTASSIAGEREKQTLDILLSTAMEPGAIIRGKLFSNVGVFMIFIISGLPIMTISFLYGGVAWYQLLFLILVLICHCILFGMIGIWCSVIVKRTISSIILSFFSEAIIMILPIFLYVVILFGIAVAKYNGSMESLLQNNQSILFGLFGALILIFNPAVMQFVLMTMSSSSTGVERILEDLLGIQQNTGLVEFFQWAWIPLGIVAELLISYGFYRASIHALMPVRKSHGNVVIYDDNDEKVSKEQEKEEE